jgi:hypothetical protein
LEVLFTENNHLRRTSIESMPEYNAEEQNFHLGDLSTLLDNSISNPFQALQHGE